MQQIVLSSLIRQAKGAQLLNFLLQEEYSLLKTGKPQEVAGLEMTIQELIRQLVREREALQRRLAWEGMKKLTEYFATLEPEDQATFDSWHKKIINFEQTGARQASLNADLAMALWKQSGKLLAYLHKQVAPKEQNTYSAKGVWLNRPTRASLVHGRL